jgi:hypothetical protein
VRGYPVLVFIAATLGSLACASDPAETPCASKLASDCNCAQCVGAPDAPIDVADAEHMEGTRPQDEPSPEKLDASDDVWPADSPSASDAQAFDAEVGDQAAPSRDGATSDFDRIIAAYRTWQPLAQTPNAISAYIFGLCRAPTLRETVFSQSVHGKSLYLLDWANPLAQEGIARKGVPPFAPGSAIVKEKLVAAGDGGFTLVALGIMTKRDRGFDPTSGDWDYAYWEKGVGLVYTAEQSTHCGSCHAGAQDTDFVFMDPKTWLRQ